MEALPTGQNRDGREWIWWADGPEGAEGLAGRGRRMDGWMEWNLNGGGGGLSLWDYGPKVPRNQSDG